jgi:hypothetical protein
MMEEQAETATTQSAYGQNSLGTLQRSDKR